MMYLIMLEYSLLSPLEFIRRVEKFYRYVMKRIRKVDERHALMYMPPFSSFFYMTPVVRERNVVLTIHYYVGGT